MEALTKRQERILKFIQAQFRKNGYPPTIREIGNHIGTKWNHGVERHLQALQRKGHITRVRDKSRGIQLTSRPMGTEVPVIGRITAGKPILAVENVEEKIVLDPSFAKGGESFLLMVEGLSMKNAGILDGDLVLVRQQTTAESGDIVAALISDEEATVKRFRQNGDEIILEPENPDFEPIYSDSTSVKIIGKVLAVLRLLDNQLTVKRLR
ncbi:MAG TPA: transcriptional repressor LexA [Candidatus Acidoferrales bacterium]|nr:transcriptional repressor LexA [Candidatus Acidoferrales bacterium]